MPPFAFDLVEDCVVPGDAMKLALAVAAKTSGARLLSVERVDGALRMTFDRDVSQLLIVDVLGILMGASA